MKERLEHSSYPCTLIPQPHPSQSLLKSPAYMTSGTKEKICLVLVTTVTKRMVQAHHDRSAKVRNTFPLPLQRYLSRVHERTRIFMASCTPSFSSACICIYTNLDHPEQIQSCCTLSKVEQALQRPPSQNKVFDSLLNKRWHECCEIFIASRTLSVASTWIKSIFDECDAVYPIMLHTMKVEQFQALQRQLASK